MISTDRLTFCRVLMENVACWVSFSMEVLRPVEVLESLDNRLLKSASLVNKVYESPSISPSKKINVYSV